MRACWADAPPPRHRAPSWRNRGAPQPNRGRRARRPRAGGARNKGPAAGARSPRFPTDVCGAVRTPRAGTEYQGDQSAQIFRPGMVQIPGVALPQRWGPIWARRPMSARFVPNDAGFYIAKSLLSTILPILIPRELRESRLRSAPGGPHPAQNTCRTARMRTQSAPIAASRTGSALPLDLPATARAARSEDRQTPGPRSLFFILLLGTPSNFM